MGIKKAQIGNAIGQGQISLDLAEQTAPTALSNKIRLYSKDISGVAELFVRDDSSHEVQITRNGSAGGASLADANTWTQKQSMPVLRLIPQTLEPISGSLGELYVHATSGLVYLYNGVTFQPVAPLSGWFEIGPYVGNVNYSLATIGGDGKTWITGQFTSSPLQLTTNRGVTWAPITALGSATWSTAAIGYDNLTMLAGVNGGTMQMSLDGGASWNPVTPGGLTTANWSGSAIGSDNQTMLACCNSGRIFMTTNQWSTWTELQPLGAFDIPWAGVAIGQDNLTILAAAMIGRVWRSIDGGATTWDDVSPTGTDGFWTQPGIGPDNLTFMIGETSGGGLLWKTIDGAVTPWTQETPGGVTTGWGATAVGGPTPTLLAGVWGGRLRAYMSFS